MKEGFFGQYLVGKGILLRDQLVDILKIQRQFNKKLGELAISEGILSLQEVEKILIMQRSDDRLFGEIAIELGCMSNEKLDWLLELQHQQQRSLAEILIETETLEKNVISQELQNYASSQKEYENRFNLEWIKNNIKDGDVIESLLSKTIKLVSLLGNMDVYEGEARFDREYLEDLDILIIEDISGDRNLRYIFNATKNIILAVANGIMGGQGLYLSDGICLDAGCEFVNIVCGNAISKLAELGLSLEINTPQVKKFNRRYNYKFSKKEDVLVVPVLVPEGAIEIAIVGADLY